MRAARTVASWSAFVTWIYSWVYFRGIRAETDGPLPGILVAAMGVTTTLLIGAAVSGWMKLRWWPAVAFVSAFLFAGLTVWAQQAAMAAALETLGSTRTVGISDAATAMLRQRSLPGLVVLAGGPTLMALAGATGMATMRGDT